MWVITTDERHALYNLAAFEVVVAIQDVENAARGQSWRRIAKAAARFCWRQRTVRTRPTT